MITAMSVSGNIKAVETMTISNANFSSNDSTFLRAGKMIQFLPGTTITGRNNIRAYIEKFECATDEGQFATNAGPRIWNFQASKGTGTVAIQPILNEENLKVVPSVTEDKIKIFFELAPSETGFITVTDLQGKIVFTIEKVSVKDSGMVLDVSAQPDGMYILRLFGTDGVLLYKKFIKR